MQVDRKEVMNKQFLDEARKKLASLPNGSYVLQLKKDGTVDVLLVTEEVSENLYSLANLLDSGHEAHLEAA